MQSQVSFNIGKVKLGKKRGTVTFDNGIITIQDSIGSPPLLQVPISEVDHYRADGAAIYLFSKGKSYWLQFSTVATMKRAIGANFGLVGAVLSRSASKDIANTDYAQWVQLLENHNIPKKGNKALYIGLAIGAIVVLGILLLTSPNSKSTSETPNTTIPPITIDTYAPITYETLPPISIETTP